MDQSYSEANCNSHPGLWADSEFYRLSSARRREGTSYANCPDNPSCLRPQSVCPFPCPALPARRTTDFGAGSVLFVSVLGEASGAVINEKQGVLVPFGHCSTPMCTGEAVILSTAFFNVFVQSVHLDGT